MRRQKTITLNLDYQEEAVTKAITVYELTVRRVQEVINGLAGLPSFSAFVAKANEWLPVFTDLKYEDFGKYDFAPSDLKQIWDAFKEVNEIFFDLLKKAGVLTAIETAMKDEADKLIKSALTKQSVLSSNEGTDLLASITDMDGSSKPSTTQSESNETQ